MLEAKITLTAPELAKAIESLAAAISSRPVTVAQVEQMATTEALANCPTGVTVSSDGNITPIAPTPVSVPADVPAPAATNPVVPTAPVAPAQAIAPAPVAPAAPAPMPEPVEAQATQAQAILGIELETIINAGAKLVENGKMNEVIALLGNYGLQAVYELKPEQYSPFVTDLRALGAEI